MQSLAPAEETLSIPPGLHIALLGLDDCQQICAGLTEVLGCAFLDVAHCPQGYNQTVEQLKATAMVVQEEVLGKDVASSECIAEYEKMTVEKLQEQLRRRRLKVSGKKGDLVQRLVQAELALMPNSSSSQHSEITDQEGLVLGGFPGSVKDLDNWGPVLEQMHVIVRLCVDSTLSTEENLEEFLDAYSAVVDVDASSGNVEEILDTMLSVLEYVKPRPVKSQKQVQKTSSTDDAKELQKQRALEGALKKKAEKEAKQQKKSSTTLLDAPAHSSTDEESIPFYLQFLKKDGSKKKELPPLTPSQLELSLESSDKDTSPVEDLTFGPFVLKEPFSRALRRANITSATLIQKAAMESIHKKESVFLHSETGSGKTLSYLLPLLLDLQLEKPAQLMVVTPTRELAVQVAREAAALLAGNTSFIKLVVDSVFTGEKQGHPALRTERPIIIGTARQIYSALESDKKRAAALMRRIQTLVLDEVDRLLEPLGKYATPKELSQRKKHPKSAASIIQQMYATKPDVQFIGCSATVNRELRREVLSLMGANETVKLSNGPKLIRVSQEPIEASPDILRSVGVPLTIKHVYIPMKDDALEDRLNALVVAMSEFQPLAPLVFIPKEAKIGDVVGALRDMGQAEAVALHEALGFTDSKPGTNAILKFDKLSSLYKERSDGARPPLLVTSEDTARGLHLEEVDFVFLLKKPKSPDEYLHLSGRTGRQGKTGTAVSIVSYREAKAMVAWNKQLGIEFIKVDLLKTT